MPHQTPNAGRLTSDAYLARRRAMGCIEEDAHMHIFVGSTKPQITLSVPVRITTTSQPAASSWKAKLQSSTASPDNARYRSAIDFALKLTNRTNKTLVRPGMSFDDFEKEMKVRYSNAIDAYLSRCQIPGKLVWSFFFVGRPPLSGHEGFWAVDRAQERLSVDGSCWDMIKLLAGELEDVALELCFRVEDANNRLSTIEELPPSYESLRIP